MKAMGRQQAELGLWPDISKTGKGDTSKKTIDKSSDDGCESLSPRDAGPKQGDPREVGDNSIDGPASEHDSDGKQEQPIKDSRLPPFLENEDVALPAFLCKERKRELQHAVPLPPHQAKMVPRELFPILQSIRAIDVASTICLAEVRLTATISELTRTLAAKSYVLVRHFGSSPLASVSDDSNEVSEVIYSRMPLLQCAMEASNMQLPLSSIIGRVPAVESVHGDDTLYRVFAVMLAAGREEVSVVENGVVMGVITCEEVLAKIRHIELGPRRRSVIFADDEESSRQDKDKQVGISDISLSNGALSAYATSGLNHQMSYRRASSMNTSVKHLTNMTQLSQFTLSIRDDGDDREDPIEVHTKAESRAKRSAHGRFSSRQMEAQTFCTSWCSELLIAFFVLLDCSIGVAAYVTHSETSHGNVVAMCCMICVFFYERMLRTYGFAWDMLRHPFWIFDCIIVDFSSAVALLLLTAVLSGDSKSTLILIRVLRMLRIFLIVRNVRITDKLRQFVSSQRTRYTQDGFNLDLTYVTKFCIAMSLPALGAESQYRNPISEVQRFFANQHPDRFLIFNLCRERSYDPELFDGRVVKIDVQDHNPPLLSEIVVFLERAARFMEEDALHCIAVHCKGGKGRTGTMVCAWLMYTRFRRTATDAMEWFEEVRTGRSAARAQGVTQPCQKRYVRYIESVLASGGYYTPAVVLRRIVMRTCPRKDRDGGCRPWFTVEQSREVVYDSRQRRPVLPRMGPQDAEMEFDVNVSLAGDVRIIFFDYDEEHDSSELCGLRRRHYDEANDVSFFFWFHTGFVTSERTVMTRDDIDVACHDTRGKVFSDDFAIELHFDNIPDMTRGASAEEMGPFRRIGQPSRELLARSNAMSVLQHLFRPKGSRLEHKDLNYIALR